MPRISFWTIFVLFGIVSRWAEKALEDNVITLTEAAQLAEDLGPVLGVPVQLELPAPELGSSETIAMAETAGPELEFPEDSEIDHETEHKPIV